MFIKNLNYLAKVFSLLMIMSALFISSSVNAQQLPPQQEAPQSPEYSDNELIDFINAAQAVTPLQQESQMKMIQEVEDNDLTVEKFNTILDAQSTGAEVEATEEELTAFASAIEGIQEIQLEYEGVITEAITEEGISPQKYQEIMNYYQQDPELQMRINVLMEEMQDE